MNECVDLANLNENLKENEIIEKIYIVFKFYLNSEFLQDFVERLKEINTNSFSLVIDGLLGNSIKNYKSDNEKRGEILNFIFHLCSNTIILNYFFNGSKYFLGDIHSYSVHDFIENTLFGTILNYNLNFKRKNIHYFELLEALNFFL